MVEACEHGPARVDAVADRSADMEENPAAQRVVFWFAVDTAVVNRAAEERFGEHWSINRKRPECSAAERTGSSHGVEHAADVSARNKEVPPGVLRRNPSREK